jgi:hypothetical protein
MNTMWDYWICLYTQTHCVARGLRTLTIAAYQATLRQFEAFVTVRLKGQAPDQVTARDALEYLEYLRRERNFSSILGGEGFPTPSYWSSYGRSKCTSGSRAIASGTVHGPDGNWRADLPMAGVHFYTGGH